ncbi:hypothetical protein ACFFNY_25465 [Paenibacillus hodogayensis]|uniref:Peptidase S9 n=1 Tax=Paenibacillus hodogayensis TaxID=279208 RepID=A0ABV5W309_9BACL
MDESRPKWVDDLRRVHEQLPADLDFKKQLRHKLITEAGRAPNVDAQDAQADEPRLRLQMKQARKGRRRLAAIWGSAGLIGAIAAIVFILNVLTGPAVSRVHADKLLVQLQWSSAKSLGTEPSTAAAIDASTTYYAVPGQGIYRQSGLSYTKLVDGNIAELALSPSGEQLAYVIGHDIFVLNVSTLQSRTAAAAPESSTAIRSLAWSPDESKLAFVRDDPATVLVAEADLNKGTQTVIGKGASPSYTKDGKQMLYEKNDRIYVRELASKEERLWSEGRRPVVSPDGQYVLYVRSGGELQMEDVWIADLDRQTEQQVTHNEAIDAWENGKLKEGSLQPYFRVGNLAWSRDGREIGMYQIKETNQLSRDFVRYTLSTTELAPEEVVGKAIEALIYRDERYAHSFFSYDPGYLKGTSPRQVGYTIVDKAKDKQGKWTVTANMDYASQDPYYSVRTMAFTLTKYERGYRIDDMREEDSTTIAAWARGREVVTTVNDQRGELLFALTDVPADKGWTNEEVEHMVYRITENRKRVWFLIKQTKADDDSVRLRLMSFDRDSGQFQALGSLEGESRSVMMLVDESGKNVVVELERDNAKFDIAIVPVPASQPDGKPIYLSGLLEGPAYTDISTRFWKAGKLVFFVEWEGRDVFLEYSAE